MALEMGKWRCFFSLFLILSCFFVLSASEEVQENEGEGTGGHSEDSACGVPAIKPRGSACLHDGITSQIIGGDEAVPHSWPWQASLQDSGHPFCGGSLINRKWVVTAAHCDVRRSHRVILGQHNLKTKHNIQIMSIAQVFNHPLRDLHTRGHDYDIALIKLESPAQINDHVSLVCLADDPFLAGGTRCVATGWGLASKPDRHMPYTLQQACLPIVKHAACQDFFSDGRHPITDRMLCAGTSGANTCWGDSGGPLVCEKKGAWTLYGLTSWGAMGCPTNSPSVFTRITALRGWMDQTMAEN